MPPKNRRNAANQHDKRHENGLAAPGKRISKQRSNSNLNGHVNGKASSPSPPRPSPDLSQHMTQAAPNGSANGTLGDFKMAGGYSGAHDDGRGHTSAEASKDVPDVNLCNHGHANMAPSPGSPRRLDTSDVKISHAYRGNVISLATTILSSCPLRDVLAILIILLQLPPTLLTIIHFLFATLTFVPPTSGASLSTLPSINDMFQGAGGTPSLATMVFADIVILILWLILWVPAQNFTLDLAQAVIAISLGGAAAGRGGTTNSIAVCVLIIFFTHIFRFKPVRHYSLHLLWTGLSKGGIKPFFSSTLPQQHADNFYKPHGWLRSLLGVHILTQGVVRMIRRSLSRRDTPQSFATGKKSDPEAAVGSQSSRLSLGAGDGNTDTGSSSSTDGRPPGPSPATREAKEKPVSGKKKRRQATHVRSQQPLWAALASTKVTAFKEIESSAASGDAAEAHATDTSHTGHVGFGRGEERVWISELGATTVAFNAWLDGRRDSDLIESDEEASGAHSGADKSRNIYIRVNGAVWSSTKIRETGLGQAEGDAGWHLFGGEIFGLTALSSYYCEFVRVSNDELLYSTNVITQPAPAAEQASVVVSPPSQPSLRPSSPTTTLKNSISALEQKLLEQRNRLKRSRKEHKNSIAALKKEVDLLTSRLATSGGNDDRQRQRALQFSQNIKQAEDATASFALEVESLGDIPDADVKEHSECKKRWQVQRDQKRAANDDLDRVKAEADRQVALVQGDIQSTVQKRDRLQARLTGLNEKHEKLIAANAEAQANQNQKLNERTSKVSQRITVEQQYLQQIAIFEGQSHDFTVKTAQLYQQTQQLESLYHHQHAVSGPSTPESMLPATAAAVSRGGANPFTSFQFPMNSHMVPTNFRGRSSSMLSGISGFTDDLDDSGPSYHGPIGSIGYADGDGRKSSSGSGSASGTASGSGSHPGSQRDPTSPLQSQAYASTLVGSPVSLFGK